MRHEEPRKRMGPHKLVGIGITSAEYPPQPIYKAYLHPKNSVCNDYADYSTILRQPKIAFSDIS